MRDHLHLASARRDHRLARVRKLTLWIGGGAAAASLGLGTAFAHALPGHAAGSQKSGSTGASSGSAGTGTGHGSTGTGAGGAGTQPAGSGKHGHQHALAPPQQGPSLAPPAPPPVVHSGGS